MLCVCTESISPTAKDVHKSRTHKQQHAVRLAVCTVATELIGGMLHSIIAVYISIGPADVVALSCIEPASVAVVGSLQLVNDSLGEVRGGRISP